MNLFLHGVDAAEIMEDVYYREDYAALHSDGANIDCFQSGEFSHNAVIRSIPDTPYFDLETPWGYGGPVATSIAALEKNIEGWRRRQSECGRIAEFIRLHPFINPMALHGLVDDLRFNRTTVVVDLQKDEDARLKEMDRSARRRIRVAERTLNIRILASDEWVVFKVCYEAGLHGNSAASRYFFSDDFYRQLLAAPYCTAWVTEYSGEAIAAGCFLHSGVFAHTHLSGGFAEARKHNAAYLIHARAIQHYADEGYRWLHMGGGRSTFENDSLLDFKRKFSPLRASYFTAGIVFDRKRYKQLGGARGGIFQGYRFPDEICAEPGEIILREGTAEDYPSFFRMRSDPQSVVWTGVSRTPDWSLLKSWYIEQLGSSGHMIYIAESQGTPIGYACTKRKENLIETAVSVDSTCAPGHAGREILKKLQTLLSHEAFERIEAWISPENKRSIRAHEAAGYIRDQNTSARTMTAELLDVTEKQQCWIWQKP
jgi:RimJ/RimL family protein N-acetyltransferase